MIKINIATGDVQKRLSTMRLLLHDGTPFMRSVAGIMLASTKQNFRQGGRPKWVQSKRVANNGGQTLIGSGLLRRSIQTHVGRTYAIVGSNLDYAAIHQFGGKTRPHLIRAKHGKALYWPGAKHPVFSVHHPGSKIPARPYLKLQPEELKDIEKTALKYLNDK